MLSQSDSSVSYRKRWRGILVEMEEKTPMAVSFATDDPDCPRTLYWGSGSPPGKSVTVELTLSLCIRLACEIVP